MPANPAGVDLTATAVNDRHDRMEELYAQGLGVVAIAASVGLTSHTTVCHHLNNQCRCAARKEAEKRRADLYESYH